MAHCRTAKFTREEQSEPFSGDVESQHATLVRVFIARSSQGHTAFLQILPSPHHTFFLRADVPKCDSRSTHSCFKSKLTRLAQVSPSLNAVVPLARSPRPPTRPPGNDPEYFDFDLICSVQPKPLAKKPGRVGVNARREPFFMSMHASQDQITVSLAISLGPLRCQKRRAGRLAWNIFRSCFLPGERSLCVHAKLS